MMKNIFGTIFLVLMGMLLFQACEDSGVSENTEIFDPENNLPLLGVELTDPAGSGGEYFMDISTGLSYTMDQAMAVPEKIDFGMLWGSSSALNIVSISDVQRLNGWGVGKTVNENFYVKNTTEFVKLDASEGTDQIFDQIKTQQQIREAYAETHALLLQDPDNDPRYHGPSESIRGMVAGDLILAKTSKDVYAAIKVESLVEGTSGAVILTIKLDLRDHREIPPIDPSKVLELFELEVTEPGEISGDRFLNLSQGRVYTNDPATDLTDQAYYNQEKIDLIFLNDPSHGGFNLIGTQDSERLALWPTGGEVNNDWLVKNQLEVFKLEASALADSLNRNTYTVDALEDAFELAQQRLTGQPAYEVGTHGPGTYVSGLKEGELLFVRSISKNIKALVYVTSDTQGDTGLLGLEIKVDNSQIQEVAPPPVRVLTLTGVGASTSDYIDFVSGSVYKIDEAELQPENIDVAHLRGSSSKHNLISITHGAGFGAFTAALRNRIEAWPTRNLAEMVNLGSAQEYVDLYDSLDENDRVAMEAAHEMAVGLYPPEERLRNLATGDIILLKSVDRGLFVAIKVLEADDSGGITLRFKLSQP